MTQIKQAKTLFILVVLAIVAGTYGCGEGDEGSLGPTAAVLPIEGDSGVRDPGGILEISSVSSPTGPLFSKSYTKEGGGTNCGDYPNNRKRAKEKAVNAALAQIFNDLGVDVDAADVVAHFRKAGRGDKPHVPGSDDGKMHGLLLCNGWAFPREAL